MRRLHAGQRVLARTSDNQLRKATVNSLGVGGAWLVLAGGDGMARWWPARDVFVSLAQAKEAQSRAALLRGVLDG